MKVEYENILIGTHPSGVTPPDFWATSNEIDIENANNCKPNLFRHYAVVMIKPWLAAFICYKGFQSKTFHIYSL